MIFVWQAIFLSTFTFPAFLVAISLFPFSLTFGFFAFPLLYQLFLVLTCPLLASSEQFVCPLSV